jgi:hypothetical protein
MLITAILGLYKTAGVELVREQIASQFVPPAVWYDLSPGGLIVWPDDDFSVKVLYDLHETSWIAPQSLEGLPRRLLPTCERRQLVFSEIPVLWNHWVTIWSRDQAGQGHPSEATAVARILPRSS